MLRRRIARAVVLASLSVVPGVATFAQSSPGAAMHVFEKPYTDPRLTNVRSLTEGSGFNPTYTSEEQWKARAQYLKQQVLIAAGLWPMPPRGALEAVVHSPIDKGDYTVEKVFFQSHPKFYVTGNLYRPK